MYFTACTTLAFGSKNGKESDLHMITIQHHPIGTKKRKVTSNVKSAGESTLNLQGNDPFIGNATVVPFGSCDTPTEKQIVQSM